MTEPRFKVGDLVFYRSTVENYYADGSKEIGVVLSVYRDTTPLYISFPEPNIFEYEYRIKWIQSGYISTLMGFNLEKVEIPQEKA